MRGLFKIYDEPESPNEGVCLGYRMNRNRQRRGRVYDMYESESQKR